MQLPLFQNQQPRQLVSIGLEKTGSTTATTGSGAFLHPPQKLCRWTYCKMLTEHCRVHGERDEKSADLWVHVQFLASVSQACSLTRSPTGPVFLSHGSYIPYSSTVSLRMWRLVLNYFVASTKFGQKRSEKLLAWRADRLKDREGGEGCVYFIVINYVLISLATWKKCMFLGWRFICISCDFDVFHIKEEKNSFSLSWLGRKDCTITFQRLEVPSACKSRSKMNCSK